MNIFERLSIEVAKSTIYDLVLAEGARPEALQSCEAALGARLSESVVTILERCNGFDLRRVEGSVLRLYSTLEIVESTLDLRRAWKGTDCWGDLIEIAKSNEAESTYAIRPVLQMERESPLFEIWPEGWDDWQSIPPLAQSFEAWLRAIGGAIATGNHDEVYAKLWPGPRRQA